MNLPTRVLNIASLVIDEEYPIVKVQRICDSVVFF
jgi:hypothetical protein